MNNSKNKPCDKQHCNYYRRCGDCITISGNYISTSYALNNNNLLPFNVESKVQDFYKGGKILITGSTGFIGKALTEKLLRTCVSITHVYLLIRPKRGQSVEERLKDLLNNPVFDRIRNQDDSEKILSKVTCIAGDVTESNLGVSQEDMNRLLHDVTVVFHSAATVKFNESLETAVTLNTIGTQRVMLFCRKMTNLKAFIHVSTAYSNADKEEILEQVYPIPKNISGELNFEETLPEELLKKIGKKMQRKHPNTYTVTKAMAEWVVAEYSDKIPAAIVRPSIVTAAWREPFEGWVDNVSGITGIMMEIGRGTIRSIICDQRLVVDIIPVDLVVNTLVAAAWHTTADRSNAIKVYNCTSGTLNPLSWEELGAITQYHSLAAPSQYIQWYPGFTFRTNRFMHLVCEMMFHFFPAFLMDTVLRLSGSKPMMLKIYNRFKLAAKTGEFFALHQWNFASDNIQHLQQAMDHSADQELFNVDISMLNWDAYIKHYILGIRKYVLKDPVETIPSAKKKLHRLYWAHKALQLMTAAVIFKLIKN